jgi:hypothetical protein
VKLLPRLVQHILQLQKMVAGVKRKSLTSDDLMRRLENPGRDRKRARIEIDSAEDDDASHSEDQGSEDDGDNLQLSDDVSSRRLVKCSGRTSSSSDVSEETDTDVQAFGECASSESSCSS